MSQYPVEDAAATSQQPSDPAESSDQPTQASPKTVRRLKNDRIERFVRGCAQYSPPSVAKYLEVLAPVSQIAWDVFVALFPIVSRAFVRAQAFYATLPTDYIIAAYGLAVCFFGGHFAATIAVIEAFRLSGGGDKVFLCVKELYDSLVKFGEENKKDDERDDNNDGIADVDQIGSAQLFMRKFTLALRTIDPDHVNKALHGLYLGLLSAVMVVRHKFAKTIALGNSIGDFLVKSTSIVLVPIVVRVVPTPYYKWVMLIVSYVCKAIGISIAWSLQFFESIIQSSILGGVTFGRACTRILQERGQLPGKGEDDTYADEIIGWSVSALGALFQVTVGWSLMFPFNIVLLPFTIFEWFLRWAAASNVFAPVVAAQP
eukprot:m51a1_g11067 hypothetical protein (373) ;mRNA; f:541913-543342